MQMEEAAILRKKNTAAEYICGCVLCSVAYCCVDWIWRDNISPDLTWVSYLPSLWQFALQICRHPHCGRIRPDLKHGFFNLPPLSVFRDIFLRHVNCHRAVRHGAGGGSTGAGRRRLYRGRRDHGNQYSRRLRRGRRADEAPPSGGHRRGGRRGGSSHGGEIYRGKPIREVD